MQQTRSLRTLYFNQISVLEYPEINRSLNKGLKLSVQSLSPFRLSATPWIQHARPPCPSPTPGACSKSCPSIWWRVPSVSCSVVPFFSFLQSFQHQGLFQWVRSCIRWPNYCSFSFLSVLPMNLQDCFTLGLTGLISMQSKAFSRVFFNSTVQKHQFFGAQLSV